MDQVRNAELRDAVVEGASMSVTKSSMSACRSSSVSGPKSGWPRTVYWTGGKAREGSPRTGAPDLMGRAERADLGGVARARGATASGDGRTGTACLRTGRKMENGVPGFLPLPTLSDRRRAGPCERNCLRKTPRSKVAKQVDPSIRFSLVHGQESVQTNIVGWINLTRHVICR